MSKQSGRRRRFVRAFAPAVGLLAAGLLVWQGSYAAFSGTTTASGGQWSSATLSLSNDAGNNGTLSANTTATFGTTNMKPGDGGSACINVKNTGSIPGSLVIFASPVTDTAGTGGGVLSTKLDLTVQQKAVATPTSDCTKLSGLTAVGTAGALSAFQSTAAAAASSAINVAAGGYVTYYVQWTFDSGADNTFQGASTTATLNWVATSS